MPNIVHIVNIEHSTQPTQPTIRTRLAPFANGVEWYVHQPVYGSAITNLNRVGADDFAIETLGELEGETGLPSSGGTGNHYNFLLRV